MTESERDALYREANRLDGRNPARAHQIMTLLDEVRATHRARAELAQVVKDQDRARDRSAEASREPTRMEWAMILLLEEAYEVIPDGETTLRRRISDVLNWEIS